MRSPKNVDAVPCSLKPVKRKSDKINKISIEYHVVSTDQGYLMVYPAVKVKNKECNGDIDTLVGNARTQVGDGILETIHTVVFVNAYSYF